MYDGPLRLAVVLSGVVCALLLDSCGFTSNVPVIPEVKSNQTDVAPPGAIQHVVVIFQENVSFDHYFGTYPKSLNLPGETVFTPLPSTPVVEGLSEELLLSNPNMLNAANGKGAANPFRLSPSQAVTADQNHSYKAEQLAFHAGAMDLFPLSVGAADRPDLGKGLSATTGLTMGYYDGNTVTAMWNYAQHYAMSDRYFGTTFGPSVVGAINLISGQTNGVVDDSYGMGGMVADSGGGFTLFANEAPVNDMCAGKGNLVHMTGRNIGDLLNAAGVTWGFFAEGFDTTMVNPNGTTGCMRSSTSSISKQTTHDYTYFLNPFQFYASTANPRHVRPLSVETIGYSSDGEAHHQYDLHDFFTAVKAGNFPAVSYLKSGAYRDGHAGYSDPLDEQAFLVHVINFIQQRPEWTHTVIMITYDDSDGWYDHVSNVVNGSGTSHDAFSSHGKCGDPGAALPGVAPQTLHAQGRCGYGPRLPLIVISPWARPNFVSHATTDQTSILRFIEDNFADQQRLGQGSYDSQAGSLGELFDFGSPTPKNGGIVLLDETTGQVRGPN